VRQFREEVAQEKARQATDGPQRRARFSDVAEEGSQSQPVDEDDAAAGEVSRLGRGAGPRRSTRRVSYRGADGNRHTRVEEYTSTSSTECVRKALQRRLSQRASLKELVERNILTSFDLEHTTVHVIDDVHAEDRRTDPTWTRLTPKEKVRRERRERQGREGLPCHATALRKPRPHQGSHRQLAIRKELNELKANMEVHEASRHMTRFHPDGDQYPQFEGREGARVRVAGYSCQGTLRYYGYARASAFGPQLPTDHVPHGPRISMRDGTSCPSLGASPPPPSVMQPAPHPPGVPVRGGARRTHWEEQRRGGWPALL
jgi:hypothetical protein